MTTRSIQVRVLDREGAAEDRADHVAVEAPLLLRIEGHGASGATILMRTPGDDDELARGFLFCEGVIRRAEDVIRLHRPEPADEPGDVLVAELGPGARPSLDRLAVGSSSCGACGRSELDALAVEGDVGGARLAVSRAVLSSLPERLRRAQPTFDATGGVHASGLFTAEGDLEVAREDAGRHNALDKVVGWALGQGRVPLKDRVLVVSGRVSYDLAQKAVVAGIPVLAAVGAPSSFAVDVAARAGLTLVGFVRDGGMVVYTRGDRVT